MKEFLFKKKVDQSVLREGMTIPKSLHKLLLSSIECSLPKGEKTSIKIIVEGETFFATLTNVDFDVNVTNREVIQIRYSSGYPICKKLNSIFTYSSKMLSENGEVISSAKAEYINVYSAGPSTIEFKCVSSDNDVYVEAPHNYYVVLQNKTYRTEINRNFIWAPITDKKGNHQFHWDTLNDVRVNDVIISLVGNCIYAVGVAQTECYPAQHEFKGDDWNKDGLRCDVNFEVVQSNYKLMDHIDEFKHLLPEKYSPIIKETGKCNIGYLFSISKELGQFFLMAAGVYHEDLSVIQDKTKKKTSKFKKPELAKLQVDELVPIAKEIQPKSKKPYKMNVNKEAEIMISHKKLGDSGEQLVVDYFELVKKEMDDAYRLALVNMVSETDDTCGYDIVVTEIDDQEPMYIEVKTTEGNWDTPFFMSENEVEFAKQHPDRYFIYRVYDTKNEAKIKVMRFDQIPEEAFQPKQYTVNLKE